MKQGARYQAVVEILETFEATLKPLDRLCASYFKSRRYIGSQDRRFIGETVYEVLRHRGLCQWRAEKLDLPLKPRSYLLMLKAEGTLDFWKPLFSGQHNHPQALTPSEIRALREFPEQIQREQEEPSCIPSSVQFNYPLWMEPFLKNRFGPELGADFGEELQALNAPASFDLRVNPLKKSRQEVQWILQQEGVETLVTPYSPLGLRCFKRFALDQYSAFRDGLVEVQDEGSQILCFLAHVRSCDQVMDFCAGAGGKTLLLASLMNNRGHVIATDVHKGRLRECKKRLKRAGIENTQCLELPNPTQPSECPRALQKIQGRMDCVLVDAPCSGSGTWRRNPDLKWRLFPKDLQELTAKQALILQEASVYVKPGGRLLYATCSLFAQENEDQITLFLKNNPHFKIRQGASVWSEVFHEHPCPPPEFFSGPFLRLSPFRHHTDGFFLAMLSRS